MRCYWPNPPQEIELTNDQVHVWCAELDHPEINPEDYKPYLSEEEWTRAKSFLFEEDARRFVLRRGILRLILSRYCDAQPSGLDFIIKDFGKPALDPGKFPDLRFNLSCSGEIVIYGVSEGHEIGIDIERVRLDFEIEPIARRFFSRSEQSALEKLPHHLKVEAFFNCWTRKEAYIKAHGQGMSLALDQFEVTLTPGEEARLVSTPHSPAEVHRWQMHNLAPVPGYAAAMVLESGIRNFSRFRFGG